MALHTIYEDFSELDKALAKQVIDIEGLIRTLQEQRDEVKAQQAVLKYKRMNS